MNYQEMIDTLDQAVPALDEVINNSGFDAHLDTGQQLMVRQARIRIEQVVKEMREFAAGDIEIVEHLDAEPLVEEHEGWSHGG